MSAPTRRGPRVLMLANVLDQEHSGVGRWARCMLPLLASELAARGGQLALCVPQHSSLAIPSAAERIVAELPSGPPLLRLRREGPVLRALLERARSEGRPLDWLHTAHLPLPLRIPRDLVRTSWLVHDLRQLDEELVGLGRRLVAPALYRAALRRADLVCTVSSFVAHELARRFPDAARAHGATVVHNGANHLAVLPRAPAPGRPYVLGVGHLEPRKNVAAVLRALALDRELPALVWVGRGPERGPLEDLARELRVAERVVWLEQVADQDLAHLYANASACVVPSLLEGFGLPVVEALRAGAPLAHATAGALPEVAGGCGHSFDPRDPADLAAALRRALVAGTSEPGIEHAQQFTWERAARVLVDGWCGEQTGSETRSTLQP